MVWGLDTGSAGESGQVSALGHALGLPFTTVRLGRHRELPDVLPETPPSLILSFGHAVGAAIKLRDRLTRRPLLVHLGLPGHVPAQALDLVIPMPQDDYPPAPNVQFLHLPLNGATMARTELPVPHPAGPTTILIGGPSRHFQFTNRWVRRIIRVGARLAQGNAEALRVITSPRTPPQTLAMLQRMATACGFALQAPGDGNAPFSRCLAEGARFVVTGDSASMVADACRSGAPVWIFPLPRRVNMMTVLQQLSDRCFGHGLRHFLIRRGWIGGGTDFGRWHRRLAAQGCVRIFQDETDTSLRWKPCNPRPDLDLHTCRSRILSLLGPSLQDQWSDA